MSNPLYEDSVIHIYLGESGGGAVLLQRGVDKGYEVGQRRCGSESRRQSTNMGY